jgi:hypothetical protein
MCISLRLRQIIFIATAVLALGFAAPASALVVKEMSGPPQSALAGKGSGVWKKAGSRLRQVYGQFLQQGKPPLFTSEIPRVQLDKGKILINATAVSDGAQLFADLKRLGLSGGAHYGAVVSGWIPLGRLEQAVALGSLRSVSASLRPMTNVGAVTSQGVAAMHATSLGYDGTGVTVGVLSDSYNLNTSAATTAGDDIANGDLPAGGVNVLEEEPSTLCAYGSCTDEGRAMLQIVHDVAPGASLAFHTAFNGDADFAQGILDLASAGAKVIVDDVAYFAEPMFQDGIIAQVVDTVKSQGVAYFSAAGNGERRSYESPFVGSGEHLYVQECLFPGFCLSQQDVGELHNFAPSGAPVDYYQSITIPDGAALTIVLNWDQPFASVSPGNGSQSDMDIWLMNSDGVIVASSKDDNIQTGNPLEILQYTPASGSGGTYRLMISHFAGPAPGLMKYINESGYKVTVNNYLTHSSTNFGHSNAAGAEAVGAADYMYTPYWSSLSAAELSYFSSAGGTPILFDTSGNRLSSPVYRNKPGIVAPDGGNTTFFYPGSDYEGDGWPNFFGTSAAAPHAAGVAAVLKSANSALSPAQIYSALESTAAPMTLRCNIGTPGTSTVSCPSTTNITATEGYNYDAGFGFIQADQAVAAVTGGGGGGTPPAPTCSLTASPASITNGNSSTLSWTTTNATSFSIDQGIGSVTPVDTGSRSVTPTATTTYTGTATGDGGTVNCTATVTVTTPPPPAALSLSLSSSTMTLSRSSSTNNKGKVTVTVSGPDSDTVNLSVSGLPSGVTASWALNPVTISSGSVTDDLTLVAGRRGPKGSFTVTVTGTDPSSNQSNGTFLLTVTK